uniref:Immunoglobulin V-set domain-containing protein n=1 Tax=Neolamprologus brichardi TaxID=32507 RepID=A0A3Q4NBH2_NEOBR
PVILLQYFTRVQFASLVNRNKDCIQLESYEGYSESISCLYEFQYQNNLKYICRGNRRSTCRRQALITSHMEKKYRIHDDKTARIFTTTISDLHSVDAGKYWCGVTRTGKDIYTEVDCCDTVTKIESYEGFSESVSCLYESQYQNSLKYICIGNRPSTCLQQALITSDTKQNGRFRLDDEKMSRKFTVTINSLTKNDLGSYLCGVQRNSDLDVFSAVELEVKGQYVGYTVPPLLLLLMCVFAVIVYKCKHQKAKGIFWIHWHAKMYSNVHL